MNTPSQPDPLSLLALSIERLEAIERAMTAAGLLAFAGGLRAEIALLHEEFALLSAEARLVAVS